MSRKPRFQNVDDPHLIQQNLFLPPSVTEQKDFFPRIVRDDEGIREILRHPEDGLGLDLEFNPSTGKPSILGVSNRHVTGAVRWNAQLAREVVEVAEKAGVEIVGHSVVGADRPILEGALGIKTPLTLWDDTLIRFYLCNPDFCKTPGKDEDEDDSGAMGFMGLWTMGSLYTDLPAWKTCRGKACEGPCPLHDAFGYCAIDSWAGLESKFGTAAEMAEKKIPESLHRDLMELSEVTYLMEKQGVKVDTDYVQNLEAIFEADKLKIFPQEDGEYVHFNPRSPAQVQAFFSKHNIDADKTDKKAVRKVLEKEIRLRKLDGAWILPDKDDRDVDEILKVAGGLPEPVASVYRLYKYKDSGKGLKSWFDDRYISNKGFTNPRFIVPGTSMGRLASSKPNYHNIPSRGFGKRVRQAIVPRDTDLTLVAADYSQLEFRRMLYSAGYDLRDLKKDPFIGLVGRSNGQMKPAAEFNHSDERFISKSIVHAFDYFEGIQVLYGKDLDRRKKEIEMGALKVYLKKYDGRLKQDWEYRGGVVCFTGANLAERLYGNKTYDSRVKALALQELMVDEYPMLRDLHWKILKEIEDRKGVQLQTGRFLPLYGSPEDDAKMGAAMHGQGGGADYVQGIMLRYWREQQAVPLLQIHDDLTWELPAAWTDKQVKDFLWLMSQDDPRMPGFSCPMKAKRGYNLGDWSDGTGENKIVNLKGMREIEVRF